MNKLAHTLKHELLELIPVTLFFFVSFQLLAFTQQLLLKQFGISTSAFVSATIMALVVAKVVLITDHVGNRERFAEKPLIYSVLWKTAIYFATTFAFRYVEAIIHIWRETGQLRGTREVLLDKIEWPHFWAIQLWLLVLLFTFCALRQLIRAVGSARVYKIFFKESPRNAALE